MSRHLLCVAAALAAVAPARAAVLRVPADHATIQGAIAAAAAGDTVLVAPGTYLETLDFLGKAIEVRSEAGPEVTVVDARRLGPVVKFHGSEGRASALRGFTLRNGFSANDAAYDGGCIAIHDASPTVTGNHLFECESDMGGGGVAAVSSAALIRGNVIAGNRTRYLGGGGILVYAGGAAEVSANLVADNVSDTDGGAISVWAGGTPLVLGNVLRRNMAASMGGGISMVNWSDADVVENAIIDNSARTGGGVGFRVPSGGRGPRLVANTIAGNAAPEGSAIYASGFVDPALLVNDLLASPDAAPAVLCDFSRAAWPPTFDHVLAWSAGASAYAVCPDPTGTSGNVSAPPGFADAPGGDYRLAAGSPAVDAGLGAAPLLPAIDLDGRPRTSGAAVDVGAWEYAAPALAISPPRVDFGPVAEGGTATRTVTFANGGAAPVALGGAAVSPGFAVTGTTCGASLAPGATCALEVAFAPFALGPRHGALTPTVDGAPVPFPVLLAGEGAAVDLAFAPAELRFQDVTIGTRSAPATVTLSNPNAVAVALDGVAVTGTSAASFAQTNDCPASLAPGASCTATVTCSPAGSYWYVASLVPTGPFVRSQGVSLLCSGATPIEPSLALSPSSAAVVAGGAATYGLAIARGGWLADALTIGCAVDAPASTCTGEPGTLEAGTDAADVRVVVRTTARARFLRAEASARPAGPLSSGGTRAAPPLAFALLAFGFAPLARRRARALVLAVTALSLSCVRTRSVEHTPSGAYNVRVTVTSQGGAQTVIAALIVH